MFILHSRQIQLTKIYSKHIKLIQRQISTSHCNLKKKSNSPQLHKQLTPNYELLDADMDKQLLPLQNSIATQGKKVKTMKETNTPSETIEKEIKLLKSHKKALGDLLMRLCPPDEFDREKMLRLATKRFYYSIAYEIYGGSAGFHDFGPLGTAILDNMLNEWHRHFILKENILKVSSPSIIPENILKASGHVDEFADYLVKDSVTGEAYRLDHVIRENLNKQLLEQKKEEDSIALKNLIARLDDLEVTELEAVMEQKNITAPVTGNKLTPPVKSNLMFAITTGRRTDYLRPETAQSIFLNFKKLYEFNQFKLPFAAAQVGPAYRNEISPRHGLVRGREFLMAEIEHFCDPLDKSHERFDSVAEEQLLLYSEVDQKKGLKMKKWSVSAAVGQKVIANETLAYYMVRIHQYLKAIGLNENKIRFRQHMKNEMAHYACDCWDAECLTSYGWLECVGCADRSAYDLARHSEATGTSLTAQRQLETPVNVEEWTPVIDKLQMKKTFGNESNLVLESLNALNSSQLQELNEILNNEDSDAFISGTKFKVCRKIMPSIKRETKQISHEDFIPSVIEPSFGIGRLFYSLLEHCFRVRKDDEQRVFFSLTPKIAPIKVLVVPLSVSHRKQATPHIDTIVSSLQERDITVRVDDSKGSMGRRYSRSDEIAIPFAVTVDFDTIISSPPTVTLRERDSTSQVRLPVNEVASVIQELCSGRLRWEDVKTTYPEFIQQRTSKDDL